MNYLEPGKSNLTPPEEVALIEVARDQLEKAERTRKVKREDIEAFLMVHNILCGTPWVKWSNCRPCVKRMIRELRDAINHFEKLSE